VVSAGILWLEGGKLDVILFTLQRAFSHSSEFSTDIGEFNIPITFDNSQLVAAESRLACAPDIILRRLEVVTRIQSGVRFSILT